jgi:hypothetical protein
MAKRARQTQDPADLTAAIGEFRAVRRGLPAGHPRHATVLIWLAELLGLQAMHSPAERSRQCLADAVDAAVEAVRAAPRDVLKPAAERLISTLGIVTAQDQHVGAFASAEEVLSAALAATAADDRCLLVTLTVGIGAARSLRADASADEVLRQLAWETIADAERMAPEAEPSDQWFDAARILFMWTTLEALRHQDARSAAVALRMVDKLERVLVSSPELADRVAEGYGRPAPTSPGGGGLTELEGLQTARQLLLSVSGDGAAAHRTVPWPADEAPRLARRGLEQAAHAIGAGRPGALARRPLMRSDPPEPDLLRAAAADLRAALAGGLDDSNLRYRVNGTLGVCLAELHWLGEADHGAPSTGPEAGPARTLVDAIEHLDRSLATSEHTLPTVERADLLDVLARCYRELARGQARADAWSDAERTARAALRELARCVLVADDTERALEVAARANETVARAVSWCLADGRHRAAVEVAEAGRSLVLASVVLAGRVEELLRGAGEHAVADAWRHGDEQARLAGLNALWATHQGGALLTTPTVEEISLIMIGTALDAVIYLVPPASSDSAESEDACPPPAQPGCALVVGPGMSQVSVVGLPGLVTGPGTPLDRYLAAFSAAVEIGAPAPRRPEGFRGAPLGRAWADALEELGAWTYAHIVGPLIEHTRGWSLGREPRLALIPFGELAAIPYAAAWTDDPELPRGRRYAVHDLVLTNMVSARLLADVVRRPRQPLAERVVLVTDPTGEFPYARATAKALGGRQYPSAEVYGRKAAPNGPATTAALLAALPQQDEPGASLFHLSTHASMTPTPRLQTADGWLPLTRILEQARNRPPEAAGGLVITNACLTDNTRTHYDEAVTLATALLAAGATAVVGTRWPIEDDTSAVLTYRLHYHLHMGRPPADALRLAQLDLLAAVPRMRAGLHPHLAALPDARLSHPASWAGYVHHGS